MKTLIPALVILNIAWLSAQPVSISISNQNLALVEEIRNLDLESGVSQTRITDLPFLLDPASVHVEFANQDIRLIEQRFINQQAGIDQVLKKLLGHSIRLVDRELGTIQGILLSVNGNSLVLQSSDNELRLISDYTSSHLVIEKADDQTAALFSPPTLFWLLQTDKRTGQTAKLLYLTGGLNWRTTYTAILSEQEDQISLNALVTLTNASGKTFRQAKLTLIAGQLHRAPAVSPYPALRNQQVMEMMQKSEAGFEEEPAFEYHVYHLDKNTDLEDQQDTEIPLFQVTEVDVAKTYKYNYQKDNENIAVHLELLNSRRNGLGLALPAGLVRVYKKTSEQFLILGEDQLPDTPIDELFDLEIGKAFDIVAERKVLDQQRESNSSEKIKVAIEFRNRKAEDITVQVTEPLLRHRSARIISSNYKVSNQEASHLEFLIPVAADHSTTLNFELLYTW